MQNIDIEKVYNITEQIESCLANQNLNQSLLDSLVQQISETFNNSAKQSFQNAHSTKPTADKSKKNKPWFGPACHKTRINYNSAKKRFNKNKTDFNRLNLNKACKQYKKNYE